MVTGMTNSGASEAHEFTLPNSGYRLVFDEEFSTSAVNGVRWRRNWFGCGNCVTPPVSTTDEVAAYDPKQAAIQNGHLVLGLVKTPVTISGYTFQYRTGFLQTRPPFNFQDAYIEARIMLPADGAGVANWPAFWADGVVWPRDGENDIMEGLDGLACYHFHSLKGAPGNCAAGSYAGWHVFGALRKSGKVTYYYDGKLVGTITSGVTSSPMSIILAYAAATHSKVLPYRSMLVDYVHVFSDDPRLQAVTPDPGYVVPLQGP
jgi:beta-glucanase (GH16 family)